MSIIVRTPGTCNGKARIRGRRVTTAFIAKHFYAGVGVSTLAYIHNVEPFEVEAAIRYEDQRRGKK